MVGGMMSDEPARQLESTTGFRKLLSIECNPPINQVLAYPGLLPRFVQFLSFHHAPQLQFEAAWALTNISSGSSEQTRKVIESGAVPIFIQLLLSQNELVREQVMTPFFHISIFLGLMSSGDNRLYGLWATLPETLLNAETSYCSKAPWDLSFKT